MQKFATPAVFLAALVALSRSPAQAALLTSVSYNQAVEAEDGVYLRGGPGGTVVQNSLVGTTLPVSTTVSSVANYCSTTATYNFSDNGTTAVFNVATVAKFSQLEDYASEGNYSPRDFTFTLSQPAIYTDTLSYVTSPSVTTVADIGAGMNAENEPLFETGSTNPLTHSGTLSAGVQYNFYEGWSSLSNVYAPTVVSDNFTLTLTAIPSRRRRGW